MVGQKAPELRATHSISLTEAIAIEHGEPGSLEHDAGLLFEPPEIAPSRRGGEAIPGGEEPLPRFVPQHQSHASEALQQGEPADAVEVWMVAQHDG